MPAPILTYFPSETTCKPVSGCVGEESQETSGFSPLEQLAVVSGAEPGNLEGAAEYLGGGSPQRRENKGGRVSIKAAQRLNILV